MPAYQQPYGGYGPNAGRSGQDPRGRMQNQGQYQQQRYESQQGPMVNQMAYNYGRAGEADYANYGDIMNRFGNYASGGGPAASHVSYTDPFKSYGGYEEFSQTGGYSPQDIANMRARGTAPVRAAYANAQREVGRQRSLQGGYSPNAISALGRMAREQGQSGADAMQNVEAGLATARNQGRLAGLGGMSNIEGQRLNAQLDAGKFNASADMMQNQNKLAALQGMASLYGTTPGMSQAFGNQLLQGVQQGGNFGINLMNQESQAQELPGAYDQTMGRINDVVDMGTSAVYPWLDKWMNRNKGTIGGQGVNNPYPWEESVYGNQPSGGLPTSTEIPRPSMPRRRK